MMKLVLTKDQIDKHVCRIAQELSKHYRGTDLDDIVMIGLLNGGAMLTVDLAKKFQCTYLDFLHLQSYGNSKTSSGKVQVLNQVSIPITKKHVILVDDIADTGQTLRYAMQELDRSFPLSYRVVTMLKRTSCSLHVDHFGFEVPDGPFFVGYGLDDGQKYRSLPGIFAI